MTNSIWSSCVLFRFDTGFLTRPYELDLSQPFHRAIAIILTYLVPSHQTYIVARSEYLDTENPSTGFVNLALQETVIQVTSHLEPEQLKEIEGLERIRDATRDVRKAIALFQEVDQDGSGELDEEEFGLLMKTLGMNFEEGKVREVMSEYDVDGGGIIEMHEFLLFLRNQQKEAGKRLRELTEFPILISGAQYNLPPPMLNAAQILSNNTPSNTHETSAVNLHSGMTANAQPLSRKSIIAKPHYQKYTPPRHGILRINIIDGFTQKDSYRVISQGDRSNIMSIAKQSGDILQMTSFGVQNYKIRYAEALGFVQSMSKENANKISILVTILPHMASPTDARQLVNKILNNSKVEISRLKREIGQAYKVIMGQPDGFFVLDMTHEMDRFCLNRLLEISMTRAHLRSARYRALGYGRLGDTSQKGNWSCFRNELYNKKPVVITITFASPLPKTGRVEFDFVSLQRVQADNYVLNDIRFTNLLVKSYLLRSSERSRAITLLKKVRHQCEHTLMGNGKTMYETPRQIALEIGPHLADLYNHLPDRIEELETYKAKESLKVSWEYDPDIIQLTQSNLHEIYTIPAILTETKEEQAAAAAAAAAAAQKAQKASRTAMLSKKGEAENPKLMQAVNKVRLLSVASKPVRPTAISPEPESAGEAEGGDSPTPVGSAPTQAAVLPPTAESSEQESAAASGSPAGNSLRPLSSHAPEDIVQKLDNTKYVAVVEDEQSNVDNDEEGELSSTDDSDDDMEVEYRVDSKNYVPQATPAGKVEPESASITQVIGSSMVGSGAGVPPSSAGGARSRGPSLLSSMLGNPNSKRNNSTNAGAQPPTPVQHNYSPSLLRDNVLPQDLRETGEMASGSVKPKNIYQNSQTLIQRSYAIKSMPPEKRPLDETYNRFICLMASRNISSHAKASKMLEILVDLFEYSFLYARHLEMLMVVFEEHGRVKLSDHFGTFRVELFVLLFSNVVDIHNIEIVMRRLTAYEVACVIGRFFFFLAQNFFLFICPDLFAEMCVASSKEAGG